MRIREDGYDFGIIAARTIPDGVMGSIRTPNGLAVGRDYPEDFAHYVEATRERVLIAGPNTERYVVNQHGTLGRSVIIAGHNASADAPHKAESLEQAIWAVRDGAYGIDREAVVIGGPRMILGASELIRNSSLQNRQFGLRAVLWMTEFYDFAEPRRYPAEPGIPTLEMLPDNIHEYSRLRQPNDRPGRPDFDFVTYVVE